MKISLHPEYPFQVATFNKIYSKCIRSELGETHIKPFKRLESEGYNKGGYYIQGDYNPRQEKCFIVNPIRESEVNE